MMYKKAVLDRFEEPYAILCFEDGQTMRIHRDDLPPGTNAGMAFAIRITREEDTEKSNQELAEALLHEIFNKNDTVS